MAQNVSVTPMTPAQRLDYAEKCELFAIELWYLGDYPSAELNAKMAALYYQPVEV